MSEAWEDEPVDLGVGVRKRTEGLLQVTLVDRQEPLVRSSNRCAVVPEHRPMMSTEPASTQPYAVSCVAGLLLDAVSSKGHALRLP